MDAHRFDALTRDLATSGSRRRLLTGLTGGLAALVARDSGAQACRAVGRACVSNGNCCSGLCDKANPDPFKRNKCVCPPGTQECGGTCRNPATDYRSDVNNCGTCGNRCPAALHATATCTDGVCGLNCDAGRALCGGTCVDLNSDVAHCGNCSTVCPSVANGTAVCALGACGIVCNAGRVLCGNTCVTGCCIDGVAVAANTVNPAQACQSCQPAVSQTTWSSRPDGTICAAILGDFFRCCQGSCPPAPTCRLSGICCDDCATECCTGKQVESAGSCPDGPACGVSYGGQPCVSDRDCSDLGDCVCGRCSCGLTGALCDANDQCCTGSCNSNHCT